MSARCPVSTQHDVGLALPCVTLPSHARASLASYCHPCRSREPFCFFRPPFPFFFFFLFFLRFPQLSRFFANVPLLPRFHHFRIRSEIGSIQIACVYRRFSRIYDVCYKRLNRFQDKTRIRSEGIMGQRKVFEQ